VLGLLRFGLTRAAQQERNAFEIVLIRLRAGPLSLYWQRTPMPQFASVGRRAGV
jgi:hypothetical protein